MHGHILRILTPGPFPRREGVTHRNVVPFAIHPDFMEAHSLFPQREGGRGVGILR